MAPMGQLQFKRFIFRPYDKSWIGLILSTVIEDIFLLDNFSLLMKSADTTTFVSISDIIAYL